MFRKLQLLRKIAYKGGNGIVFGTRAAWLGCAAASFSMIPALQSLYDAVVSDGQNREKLVLCVLAFGVIMLLDNFFLTAANVLNEKSTFLFMEKLTDRLQHNLAEYRPARYADDKFLDEIRQADGGVPGACFLLGLIQAAVWYYLPYLALIGIYYFCTSPSLLLLIILLAVPVLWGQVVKYRENEKLADTIAKCERKKREYASYFTGAQYAKEARVYGNAPYFLRLFARNMETWKTARLQKAKKLSAYSFCMDALSAVFLFAGVLGMALLAYRGKMTVPAFAAVLSSIGSVTRVLNGFLGSYVGRMMAQSGNVKHLTDYLRPLSGAGETKELLTPPESIEFSHVRFSYPNSETETLSDVSCTFTKRETVVIVGENGAGKSTFTRLLAGLYAPTAGEVRYNGANTEEYDRKDIYRKNTVLLQEFQKYKASVRENVALAENADDTRLWGALSKAGLSDRAEKLPQRENALLGREFGGAELSGGEWQRLALARTMYHDADIVCLDEPTSAVSPLEESALYETFHEMARGKFAFIVSHRLGLCKIADRILVIKDGAIAGDGTHEELMQKCGYYRALYEKQAGLYRAAE